MNTALVNYPRRQAANRRRQALTLVELMIAMTIFSMVVLGFVTLQMFGLRYDQLVQSKLGASDQSRQMLEKMGWEIRSAKMWEVGNVSGSSFVEIADGQPQRGTGIRIYTSIVTNTYIQYYFNTNTRTLLRSQSGVSGSKIIAQDLTNTMTFQAEDHRGTVQTAGTGLWRNCIRVILEFAQYQYPLTQVGPGKLYDYYKMEFKISPHSPSLP
jgi:prepilin-type N-terminal cleavage/methylation domain-containing protein